MKLAFVGLGQMGKHMAVNLLKSGAELIAVNRGSGGFAELEAKGATTSTYIADTMEADIIFLCLPGSEVVKNVLLGENGIADGLRPGQIVVDTSTITYSATLEIAEALEKRGVAFLDAPVSGMEARARDGTLTIMCGGAAETFRTVEPLLACMGDTILHMGKTGSGQLTKLINQLLFDINVAALAEILPMAMKMGLDPDKVGSVVNSGTGRSYASEFFIPRILRESFSEGYALKNAYKDLVSRLSVTAGTCAVMGTASTMACIAETLGMSLPNTAAMPAVDSGRLLAAEQTGKAAVRLIHDPITPDRIITEPSVENAFRVLMALGGSTNAIVHLTAIAGRLGIAIPMQRLNEISDETPVLVNLKPVGEGYMEDFHAAGGVHAVLRELRPLLHLDCLGVDGRTLRERLDEPKVWVDRKIIRPFAEPISPLGGLIALHGSLAPDGAILKRAAATPALFEVEGRAVVFEGLEELSRRIDDPDLDVTAHDILVLKNAGPQAAGMPEAGYLPIPAKLARAGVTDMVRISDARMSGTAYGTIVLHAAPEAAVGGPLAAVRNGDRIALSVQRKRLDLLVEEREIQRRLESWSPPPVPERGYRALFRRSVLQAPQGCDFDFLTKAPGHG